MHKQVCRAFNSSMFELFWKHCTVTPKMARSPPLNRDVLPLTDIWEFFLCQQHMSTLHRLATHGWIVINVRCLHRLWSLLMLCLGQAPSTTAQRRAAHHWCDFVFLDAFPYISTPITLGRYLGKWLTLFDVRMVGSSHDSALWAQLMLVTSYRYLCSRC